MADSQETLRRQTERQIKAREAEIDRFVLTLEKFLRANIKTILKRTNTGNPREAAIYLGSLFQALEDAGLRDKVAEIERIFTNEVGAIRLDFEASTKKNIRFADADAIEIQTLIDFQEDRIFSTITNLVDDTKATLLESIISGVPPELDDLLDTLTGRMAGNVNTELNTAVMSFNRSVQMAKAQEFELNLFLYVGPEDKVTRDFCEELLSQDPPIYTKDEIDAMDNGQGLPVATSGGGYNCRHHWRPVSKEFAKQLGYDD